MSVRSMRFRLAGALVALGVTTSAVLAPSSPAQADLDLPVPLNYIFNNGRGTGGLGVTHDQSSRLYDAVLPNYATTRDEWGWDHASSFYIGPGYCYNYFRMIHGGSGIWIQRAWNASSGSGIKISTDYNYDYQVQPYRPTNGQC